MGLNFRQVRSCVLTDPRLMLPPPSTTLQVFLHLAKQVLEGVQYMASQSIVHRDLKVHTIPRRNQP